MPVKRARSLVLRQKAQLRQIRPEQPVRVAADGILGDAERRAEHARLGEMIGILGVSVNTK